MIVSPRPPKFKRKDRDHVELALHQLIRIRIISIFNYARSEPRGLGRA